MNWLRAQCIFIFLSVHTLKLKLFESNTYTQTFLFGQDSQDVKTSAKYLTHMVWYFFVYTAHTIVIVCIPMLITINIVSMRWVYVKVSSSWSYSLDFSPLKHVCAYLSILFTISTREGVVFPIQYMQSIYQSVVCLYCSL
jgi:hypothetical protein